MGEVDLTVWCGYGDRYPQMNVTIAARLFAGIALLASIGQVFADPRSDLESRSQEIRDAAAKILRDTYSPPSSNRWSALLESIKVGDHKTNVEVTRPLLLSQCMC